MTTITMNELEMITAGRKDDWPNIGAPTIQKKPDPRDQMIKPEEVIPPDMPTAIINGLKFLWEYFK